MIDPDTHDRLQTYWTPQRVVSTLLDYTDIADRLAAGIVVPQEHHRTGVWEPGSHLEKCACQKADIDLAMGRLSDPVRKAVHAYFVDGLESFRAVARALKTDDHTAASRVRKGVSAIAARLCNRRSAGDRALELLPGVKKPEKRFRTFGPSATQSVIDEGTLRAEARERARHHEP